MPKVELHVHLEGAIRPETLLELAQRHKMALPHGNTLDAVRDWFTFRDFAHFIEVYVKTSEFIRTPDDIEFITRAFLQGQAEQNIRYSEVTYTAYTHYQQKGLTFEEQLDAISRARRWAESQLGVSMGLIIDIPRFVSSEEGVEIARRTVKNRDKGVVAFGLGGPEIGHPPEKFVAAFQIAHEGGLPSVPHAGETVGPESIWGAINYLSAVRIGHGVRCIEDDSLVAALRERQIVLEVCPTSNICLGIFPSIQKHSLPHLVEAGLRVTINSDDPPMFNTTLTDEYQLIAENFGYDADDMQRFVMTALEASFLPPSQKQALRADFEAEFAQLGHL